MRLIDADRLKTCFQHEKPSKPIGLCYERIIDEQPTINAEPERKKGEWINKEFYGIGEGSAECSTCHKRSSGYKEDDGWGVHCLFYDFCPICGSCNRESGE